jgi:hypothetical protein
MYRETRNTCAFCPETAEMTCEHLWPVWASELIGKKRYTNIRQEIDGRVFTWEATTLNAKTKVVCHDCNSGWMNDLENRMKNVCSEMILNGSSKNLSGGDVVTISAYGFLKSVVADYMHENRPPFYTSEERSLFRRFLSIPLGVQVWLGKMDGLHAIFKGMGGEAPLGTPNRFHMNIFTYGLGYILIQVTGCKWMKKSRRKYFAPPLLDQGTEWAAFSIPVFPNCNTPIAWPPISHLRHESINIFVQRWINLNRTW